MQNSFLNKGNIAALNALRLANTTLAGELVISLVFEREVWARENVIRGGKHTKCFSKAAGV